MIDDRVRLIAISWIPTQGGLVNPAAEVGAVARDAGVPYLLDACQAAGQLPIDVDALGCDFLSATGRKYLRAPRGTGLLYVRRPWIERLEPPFLDVHAARWVRDDAIEIRADARRFETWEHSVANRLGLGRGRRLRARDRHRRDRGARHHARRRAARATAARCPASRSATSARAAAGS